MKNIKTMTRLASKADIEVVLCTILPAARYRWRPEIEPVESIRDMNRRIRCYAKWHRLPLVDFYTTLAAADGSLPSHLSKDGVHPNSDCYTIMEPLILSVLE